MSFYMASVDKQSSRRRPRMAAHGAEAAPQVDAGERPGRVDLRRSALRRREQNPDVHLMARLVKVFGCRPSQVARLGTGRRTETAHVRTRGQRARRLWGFEESGAALQEARRPRSAAHRRQRAEKVVFEHAGGTMPRLQAG